MAMKVSELRVPGYYWLLSEVDPPFIVEMKKDDPDRVYYCGDEVGLAIDGEWSEISNCELIGPLRPPV